MVVQAQRPTHRSSWLLATLAALVVLAAAALYEAAVALGWIPIGPVPGEGPVGGGAVRAAAFLAGIAGAGVCVALAPRPEARPRTLAPLLPLAAAAFIVAHFYAYDPYFAPSLRRFSEGEAVFGLWIVALALAAGLAAVASFVRPRVGLKIAALVVFVSALTGVFIGVGH